MSREVVAIVGGGPAGLAAAACVKRLGFTPRVLEQSPAIGTRWRGHYDRLRLHTTRRMSSLPGLEIPPRFGRWVSRDDFARYQELYAAHHRISVEAGTSVARIDRVARTDDRGGFRVETSRGPIEARHVIVATGYNNVPRMPTWPGTEQFAGELAHSSRFKNGEPYRGKRVIVVGTGNSGAEIATDLAEHGATVWWSVRTPPTILRRDLYGIPVQGVGVALEALPPQLVDRVIRVFRRFTVGDLDAFGLPMPARGPYVRALTERVLPILDVGIVAAIRAGRVRVVPEIRRFEPTGVELAEGKRLAVDAVIAATGFSPALEPMVGHLGVLDDRGWPITHGAAPPPSTPDLFFLGYTSGVTGSLREISADARRIAERLAHLGAHLGAHLRAST